eukprot:jgi/Mesvir1/400/Mv11291-RA.1
MEGQGDEVNRRNIEFPTSSAPSEDLVHGAVSKQVIREGTGDAKPQAGSMCFVHFRGWLAESKTKFVDTWETGVAQLQLGGIKDQEGRGLRGVKAALGSMRKGERCLLNVGPEYGYGKAGHFSFPSVPPDSHLVYEVELISFSSGEAEGKPRSMMLFEERLEAANAERLLGNAACAEADWAGAAQHYEMALSYLDEDVMFQLMETHAAQAQAVTRPCHLNLALCKLKLGEYTEAALQSTHVLTEEPNNVKALFRRGRARRLLGQTEEARADLTAAAALAPNDSGIKAELQLVRAEEAEAYRQQKKVFGGFLGKGPEGSPGQGGAQKVSGGVWARLVAWAKQFARLFGLGFLFPDEKRAA